MKKFSFLLIFLAVIGLNLGHTCRLMCLTGSHKASGEVCHLDKQAAQSSQSHECHHGKKDSEKPAPSLNCDCSAELFAVADFETTLNAVSAPPSYFSTASIVESVRLSYISIDPAAPEGPPRLLA